MKTALSILLSLSLTFQSLHLKVEDLWGVQELLEHVQMHADKYGDSLTDFFVKHYGSLKIEHYETHSEHDKLPFNQQSSSPVVSLFLLDHQELPCLRVSPSTVRTSLFFYKSTYTSVDFEDIFQPPKNV